jgi:hypothetical protein
MVVIDRQSLVSFASSLPVTTNAAFVSMLQAEGYKCIDVGEPETSCSNLVLRAHLTHHRYARSLTVEIG